MAISKKDVFSAILALDITEDIQVGDVTVTPADITETLEKAIEQLDSKAAKAKEKAAEKKAAGDSARALIRSVITEEPKTIADISAEINDPELTNAMIVARLTQLVNLGEVFRSEIKVENRKVKAYSTVTDVEVTE